MTSAPGSSTAPTGSSSGGTTTTIKLKGSSSSNFCDLARADGKAFKGANVATLSAADLKKDFENLGPALQHAADLAPDAIKGDFQVFVKAFEPYLKALADANYDFVQDQALVGLRAGVAGRTGGIGPHPAVLHAGVPPHDTDDLVAEDAPRCRDG